MDTPHLLLEHHLKQLRLPTMLREYSKLAEQCAKEGVDFQRFLLRLVELEDLRSGTPSYRTAHQGGKVSSDQKLGYL